MADIAVFKERRMTGNDNSNELSSYFIKDSYKGILRLSPNNSATLLGINNGIELNEITKDTVRYNDSLSNVLTTQFISVSSSDGIELDLKLSDSAVEYNNLYILGALEVPSIVVYTNKNTYFKLGDYYMPINHNPEAISVDTISEYKEPTIDELEDTYILVNTAEDGEPTKFEFKNVKSIIGSLVSEELTKLSALPTGSIHWIPVNIEQYQKLLEKSNNTHNSNDINCDTLIRDFLLCDGKEYNNIDYPELAKILYKENIIYWADDNESGYMTKHEGPAVDTENYKFRVPDLRSMFMQYIIPPPALQKNIENDKNYFGDNNRVGKWEIDSQKNAEIIIKNKLDKHYHYIVLDNSTKNQHNTPTWSNNTITLVSAINGTDDFGLPKLNSDARALAKYAGMREGDRASGTSGPNLNTTKRL